MYLNVFYESEGDFKINGEIEMENNDAYGTNTYTTCML